MRAVGEYILVQQIDDKEAITTSGIIMTSAGTGLLKGVIHSVGIRVGTDVQEGDVIYFNPVNRSVMDNGLELKILVFDDIITKV